MSSDAVLRQKLASVWGLLDERTRRLMAANEARSLGYGGVSRVNRACGLSRNAIARGIEEITAGSSPGVGRIRRAGAGRRPITARDPHLLTALDRLIDPDTRGDPESPLRWICKSTRTLAAQSGDPARRSLSVRCGVGTSAVRADRLGSCIPWWAAQTP
jgi:hypothetical protein